MGPLFSPTNSEIGHSHFRFYGWFVLCGGILKSEQGLRADGYVVPVLRFVIFVDNSGCVTPNFRSSNYNQA